MQGDRDGTNRSACASCKHQRKKCRKDCALAPFFPAGKEGMFKSVHRIFGVRNVQKMIIRWRNRHASEDQIKVAMDSVIWQAESWDKHPFEGCYGEFRRLCWEYEKLSESHKRLHSLLNMNASEHHQLQRQQQVLHHQNLQFHGSQFIQQSLNNHQAGFTNNVQLLSKGVISGGGCVIDGEDYNYNQNFYEMQGK